MFPKRDITYKVTISFCNTSEKVIERVNKLIKDLNELLMIKEEYIKLTILHDNTKNFEEAISGNMFIAVVDGIASDGIKQQISYSETLNYRVQCYLLKDDKNISDLGKELKGSVLTYTDIYSLNYKIIYCIIYKLVCEDNIDFEVTDDAHIIFDKHTKYHIDI